MNLNNRTLSSTIMSGAPYTDEQQAVHMRQQGGENPVLDAYNRTGNMKVARILSKYSKKSAQVGAKIPPRGLSNIASGNVSFEDPFGADVGAGQDTKEDELSWFEKNAGGMQQSALDIGSGLLNVSSSLANIKDYRGLPSVPTPGLERSIDLEKPDLESTRQAIIAQGRNMQNQVGSGQAGQQIAQRAIAMGSTQSALSQLAGQEERMQQQVENQNRMANQQVQARNLQTTNRFYDDQNKRELAIIKGVGYERSKISQNLLGSIGDVNQRKLDKQRMSINNQRNNMTGSMKRWAEGVLTNPESSYEDKQSAIAFLKG